MKIISEVNTTVLKILKPFQKSGPKYRWLRYCIHATVNEGILVFNLMTREMILLTKEEFDNYLTLPYLYKNWFVVPENVKEKEFVDIIKLFIKKQQTNFKDITNYSVFTTTDCNARCFYCYEAGCSKSTMTQDTCEKIVKYIQGHCGNKQVRINWFGGEPLLNTDAIDYICRRLQEENIPYKSKMITNGYLFSEANAKKAATCWNLQEIQITLDGTENVYNQVKDYIYNDASPYKTVLSSIHNLLNVDIPVSIRLNLDLYNTDDILNLIDELANKFKEQKIYVYVHKLFQEKKDYTDQQAAHECELLEKAVQKVEEKLIRLGLKPKQGIPKVYKTNYCMADCGNAITFLPKGDIGLCEVHTDNEFIGHIDKDGFDESVITSWKELTAEIPACSECSYFPECYVIKKCASASVCYPAYQEAKIRQLKERMIFEYENYMLKL